MIAEIICSGTEILLGSILNTNARYLSQRLAEHAIDVHYQTTVGDNIGRLAQSFEIAAGRSDIVICCGGLGPTEDDVTVRALAQFLQVPLILHEPTFKAVSQKMKRWGFQMNRLVAKQCYVPHNAVVFENTVGTAPGILCEARYENGALRKWFLLLPGPPREMEPMFIEKALPALFKKAQILRASFKVRTLRVAGLTEAQVAPKVNDLLKLKPPLTVGIYAKLAEVELKVMAKSGSASQSAAMVRRTENEIRRRLGKNIYGADDQTLSSVVGKLLKEKKKTLSAAESCTGGLFSSVLTDTPGSSDYFLGSVIAYDNWVKTRLLGVDDLLLRKKGAVSAEVAQKMAQSIRLLFRTDIGIGITGIAGPSGALSKKPVGLVYIALALGNRSFCKRCLFPGDRPDIKSRAATEALDLLRLSLIP